MSFLSRGLLAIAGGAVALVHASPALAGGNGTVAGNDTLSDGSEVVNGYAPDGGSDGGQDDSGGDSGGGDDSGSGDDSGGGSDLEGTCTLSLPVFCIAQSDLTTVTDELASDESGDYMVAQGLAMEDVIEGQFFDGYGNWVSLAASWLTNHAFIVPANAQRCTQNGVTYLNVINVYIAFDSSVDDETEEAFQEMADGIAASFIPDGTEDGHDTLFSEGDVHLHTVARQNPFNQLGFCSNPINLTVVSMLDPVPKI